jgi:hypothetical protein
MKMTFKLLVFLFTVSAAVTAQVVPEAEAGHGLPVHGYFHYDLRYSQTADFGSGLGNYQTANASGDADYRNRKETVPFTLNYGGGYTWTLSGPSYLTGFFQHVLLSQGLVRHKWNVLFSDNVSYTPAAPTTGFSGVPGTGDIGGSGSPTPPVPPAPPDQTILTVNTHTLFNSANGVYQRTLNYATTLNVSGSSSVLYYPDGNGFDTDSWNLSAGCTRDLNKHNLLTGQYSFTQDSYPGFSERVKTNTVLATYRRQWTRRLTTDAGVGPEWVNDVNSTAVTSSSTTGTTITTTPGSTDSIRVSGNAGVTYNMRYGSAGVNYSHGTSGGAGYTFGAENDTASANYSREFNKTLTVGITGSYMRTVGLQATGVINAKYGGIQASRRMGRYFSAFANYTALEQSSSSALPANALSGLTQLFGFGISYSPRETHLKLVF